MQNKFQYNKVYFNKILEPVIVLKHNVLDFPNAENNLDKEFKFSFNNDGIISADLIKSKRDVTKISIEKFNTMKSQYQITELFDMIQYSGSSISAACMSDTDIFIKNIDEYGIFEFKNNKTICIYEMDPAIDIVKKYFDLETALGN